MDDERGVFFLDTNNFGSLVGGDGLVRHRIGAPRGSRDGEMSVRFPQDVIRRNFQNQ